MLKSIDGGATWTKTGLSTGVNVLALDPANPRVLYAATEGPGLSGFKGLFKSTDAAETWFPINLGLGGDTHYDVSISGLVMDPESPDTLYAATAYHSVYKTSTGGR